MPDFVSRSASFCSIVLRVVAEIIFARSTTRPDNAGSVRARAVARVHANSAKTTARCTPPLPMAQLILRKFMSICRGSASEFHLWWRLHALACSEFRHGLVGGEKQFCPDRAWKRPEFGVVDAHRLDVIAPSDSNPIFGALKL